MNIEELKKELLQDKEFMDNVYNFVRKEEIRRFDEYIKKLSSVGSTTNDNNIKN